MKIMHVLDHSIPLHSGYSFRTRAILLEQQRRGWEVVALTSTKHGPFAAREETYDGIRFLRTPETLPAISKLPVLGQLAVIQATSRALEACVAAERPDILHAHSPCLNAIAAARVAQRAGLPFVYEVRAFWEDAAVDLGTARDGGARYRLSRALETRSLLQADHVTTICEGLRGDMLGRGVPKDRITVIPNSVNVGEFPPLGPADPEFRRSLNLDDCLVLGFIGSFYSYEGLSLLLDAFVEVVRKLPQARVLLVGGGPEEARLKAQTHRLGLRDTVRFVGRVPHDTVAKYYSIVDLLVFPRLRMRLTELVTPLKPLEAMAQRRGVLASDVGGHRELISDGTTGWLFPAGDAHSLARRAVDVLLDVAGRTRVCDSAQRFVEAERTWPATVARYQGVYESATSSRGSRK